ncbi:hypothetical protein, partial [Kitasatospora cineracea]|uniref:hypothetical protein n=1 Tax=Kitasatospora cineracea TaxID=88074 RepID=UPI0033CC6413
MNLSGDPVADRQDGFPAGELAPGEAADRAVAGILDAVVDSIGHALTVTVVQAGAAREVADPAFRERALE